MLAGIGLMLLMFGLSILILVLAPRGFKDVEKLIPDSFKPVFTLQHAALMSVGGAILILI